LERVPNDRKEVAMRYRVEIDREPRAKFAKWVDALRFAKAAAAADEERTVQVIETGEREELILSMRHGKLAILGSYSYTLPEERAAAREEARRRRARRRIDKPTDTPTMGPVYYVKEDDILYRVRNGKVGDLPDEVLWRSGWRPILGCLTVSRAEIPGGGRPGGPNNQADPLLMTKLSVVTKAQAQEIARKRGLPTEGWDPQPPKADRGDERRPGIELNDEEHELILDNPEADAYIAEQAVRRAIADGMDPELAERLYRSGGRDSSRRRTMQEEPE
jgi:hypothetical protein